MTIEKCLIVDSKIISSGLHNYMVIYMVNCNFGNKWTNVFAQEEHKQQWKDGVNFQIHII